MSVTPLRCVVGSQVSEQPPESLRFRAVVWQVLFSSNSFRLSLQWLHNQVGKLQLSDLCAPVGAGSRLHELRYVSPVGVDVDLLVADGQRALGFRCKARATKDIATVDRPIERIGNGRGETRLSDRVFVALSACAACDAERRTVKSTGWEGRLITDQAPAPVVRLHLADARSQATLAQCKVQ
jgi:hypothetical protein